MLILDVLRLSTRMFRTNRSRTLLTILGIGVGIGAILFLVSFGYGLQKLILDQITNSDALLSLDVTTGDVEELKLDKNTLESIKKINGVDKIIPVISTQAQMTIDDISTEILVNFADSDFFKLDGTTLANGDFYKEGDKNKVIISQAALQLFNLDKDKILEKKIKFNLLSNKEVNLSNKNQENEETEYQVVGVVSEESSNYVFLPFEESEVLKTDIYNKIKIKVDREDNLAIARDQIMEKGFTVSALSDTIEQANQIFKVVQIVLASFGIVALIVSAIGMFNTMTIALLERTQEIGIMKALGATATDIWSMFLSESIIIGFFGGLCGVTIGFLGGELFNYGINLLAGVMGGDKIDMFYTPYWFVVLIMSFSSIVGLMTGFYPAKRAASINCLKALRYK